MYKKVFGWIVVLLCTSFIVSAYEMCSENIKINSPCTMLTSTLGTCSIYNYTIIIPNGTEVTSENLTLINENIYNFNFTELSGEFLIKLCDGTTREVIVSEDEKMNQTIIFGLAILTGFLIFFGSKMNNPILKWVAYMMACIEAVLIAGGIYLMSINIDLSNLLQINMYIFSLSMLGLLLFSLTTKNIEMSTGMEYDELQKDDGFHKDWNEK